MAWYEMFGSDFENIYQNPDVVTVVFFLLVFVVVFAILTRFDRFRENRGIALVIAFAIAGLFFYRFRELIAGLALFNFLLVLASLGIVFIILRAFFRFGKKQF